MPKSAHAYSNKTTTHNWWAWYNAVPFGIPENVNNGINQYQSGSNTVVTHDTWGAVVHNGLISYPEVLNVYASAYLIDSHGSSWQAPDNYPYCFVGSNDAYQCGDTQTISHSVYNSNNSAKSRAHSAVVTFDDLNDVFQADDYWTLTSY